jgi:vacuolar-type H+-ATPase subunit I/STV1
LPADANADQKTEHAQQEGALVFYNRRKDEDILCQFVNGLAKELREVLIRQDDLLKKSVESVLKQISTLEEEQGLTRNVYAAQRESRKTGESCGRCTKFR